MLTEHSHLAGGQPQKAATPTKPNYDSVVGHRLTKELDCYPGQTLGIKRLRLTLRAY